MLGLEDLRVTPEQPAQHVLAGATRTDTDLAERRLERLVVAKAASAERLLDRVVEVVAWNCATRRALSPQTLTARSTSPSADPGAEQHRQRLQDRFVVFSDVLVLAGSRQSKGYVHVLQRVDRDAGVSLNCAKVRSSPGMTSPRALEIPQREMSRGVGG